MKQIYKSLMSVIIILMLASTIDAQEQIKEKIINETNLTVEEINETNLTVEEINETNLTVEEIKILKELIQEEKSKEKPLNITEIMKKAKVPSKLIPSISTKPNISNISNILSAYTNPVSGISVQRTGFSNTIYTNDYVNWVSWGFYLPENSYAYVEVSGNVGNFKYYADYIMDLDNSQYTNWAYDVNTCRDTGWFSSQPACDQEIQRSGLFYLTKGWHTLNLNGYANRFSDSYWVNGFISLIAFPEYTAIKVNSPNGGENWTRGTTKIITWTRYGQPGANVKIELYKGGVLSSVISSKTSNDGSYSWYVPSYQPIGTDYKIKITSYEESKYYDWSDNNFRIS